MSSIKSVMEKYARSFQEKEIKRFNDVIAKVIDNELTRKIKDGNLASRYFIQLSPTPSHTYLIALKKTSDPTEPDMTLTVFHSELPVSVFRNVFKKAYGKESTYYDHKLGCTVYYYSFDFIEIANK